MELCANCNLPIEGEYYKCLDNYMQVKYFDSEECNVFCSQECFCKSLSLESFESEGDKRE